MGIGRRRFLGTTLLGGGAALVGCSDGDEREAATTTPPTAGAEVTGVAYVPFRAARTSNP